MKLKICCWCPSKWKKLQNIENFAFSVWKILWYRKNTKMLTQTVTILSWYKFSIRLTIVYNCCFPIVCAEFMLLYNFFKKKGMSVQNIKHPEPLFWSSIFTLSSIFHSSEMDELPQNVKKENIKTMQVLIPN